MPRVKEAYDWLLTYSPEENVTKDNLPEYILAFMHSKNVTHAYAVLEQAEKSHLHIAFRLQRHFNSDYKWWVDGFKEHGLEAPALDIRYHNDILTLVGGYCSKDENHQVLFNRGFSEEQLEYGAQKYQRRNRRQAIRRNLDDYISIPREKFEVALAAEIARTGCTRDEAEIRLAQDGFAFASSKRGMESVYTDILKREISLWPQNH